MRSAAGTEIDLVQLSGKQAQDIHAGLKGLRQSGPQTLGTSPPAPFRERIPLVEFNLN